MLEVLKCYALPNYFPYSHQTKLQYTAPVFHGIFAPHKLLGVGSLTYAVGITKDLPQFELNEFLDGPREYYGTTRFFYREAKLEDAIF